MDPNEPLNIIRSKRLPWVVIATTTIAALAVGLVCLSSGCFIIFQNLFYIPIIIACVHYAKRGFWFSVIIAGVYFLLMVAFTRDPMTLLQALVRVFIFVLIAGIMTHLSLAHKRVTERLQKNRKLLVDITTRAPGVVYQFYGRPNGEKGLYYVSDNSERFLGLKPDLEKFFENFTALVIPEHREDFVNSIDKAIREVSEWKYEGMLEKPSGERIWFFGNSVPLQRVGEVVFSGILTDITERKMLEAEKKKMEDMRALVEMKSRFTAMVSHELRSPLGVPKEALDVVLEGMVGDINDEQKNILGMAKRNIDRLGRLINNVQDFQKIVAGKMEFDICENDLNEALAEVGGSMSVLAKRKNLELQTELVDNLPKVKFDKDRIIQVCTNLVSNAISNTERGKIILAAKKENDVMHISVQDAGGGISLQDIPKLFQPFEQVESNGAKKKGGTGLGLAISKEIILAHHGKIWAESSIGKGSTFHFTLPL